MQATAVPLHSKSVSADRSRHAIDTDSDSMPSRGDAYDNALAESVIGLFKTEVIHQGGPWRSLVEAGSAAASVLLRTGPQFAVERLRAVQRDRRLLSQSLGASHRPGLRRRPQRARHFGPPVGAPLADNIAF